MQGGRPPGNASVHGVCHKLCVCPRAGDPDADWNPMGVHCRLYNWRRINPQGPITTDNLRLIRAFTGHPSEAGFILVHVAMVAHSGAQVRATLRILRACQEQDHTKLARAMETYLRAMRAINLQMETMWTLSHPDDYKTFRTFIMGLKNQPMFPDGVTYQGVPEETGKDRQYRGESGANDSIIPSADNLFQAHQLCSGQPRMVNVINHTISSLSPPPLL